MGIETIDYAAILADLEAKKAALENAIISLRSAIALGAAGQAGDIVAGAVPSMGGVSSIHNGEVPAGAFLGKSIPDAAKLYLEIVKKKQTTKEIADGLRRGGIESASQNFQQIVHSILDRARKSGSGIVKLEKSTWGLAEWYPRGVANVTVAPMKKGRGKKKKGQKKTADIPGASAEASSPAPIAFKERALGLLRQNPVKEFSVDEMSKELGIHRSVVIMQMGKLVKSSHVEKVPSGGYRMNGNLRQMPVAAAAV